MLKFLNNIKYFCYYTKKREKFNIIEERKFIYDKENSIKKNIEIINTKFYDLLEISKDSSLREIKKSYYKQSQKYHPDKHININEQQKRDFTEKFKNINNAYSVLSDPEKKYMYDKFGIDSKKKETISSDLFTEIFSGNNDIAFFIGKLRIFSFFDIFLKDSKNTKDFDLIELNQNKREIQIIESLSKIIDNPNAENDVFLSEKINKIMENPVGELIINQIAFIYIETAHDFLEKKKIKNFLKKKKNALKRLFRLLISATLLLIKDGKKKLKVGSIVWSIITLDIDVTIRSSCFKLFTDNSVNKQTRINRAKNILKIGKQIYNENINYKKKCSVIGTKIDEIIVFN